MKTGCALRFALSLLGKHPPSRSISLQNRVLRTDSFTGKGINQRAAGMRVHCPSAQLFKGNPEHDTQFAS